MAITGTLVWGIVHDCLFLDRQRGKGWSLPKANPLPLALARTSVLPPAFAGVIALSVIGGLISKGLVHAVSPRTAWSRTAAGSPTPRAGGRGCACEEACQVGRDFVAA